MPKIVCENLTVTFYDKRSKQQVNALDSFSCSFDSKKINVIIGESGSGKTTLLRAIMGFEKYTGSLKVGGREVNEIPLGSGNYASVSQNLVLYPHLTIFNNIAFPLSNLHVSDSEKRRRVAEVAHLLQIDFLLFRKPRELSIGQQQRVALARALIKRPDVVFLDEPFSNVDEQTTVEIRKEMKKIFTSLGTTVLFVTHDVSEAMRVGDKVFVMEDGKIIDQGEPLEVYESEKKRTQEYFQILNKQNEK